MENNERKNEELEPVNINEEFVKQCVRKTIRDLGGCGCEICYADACALALNALQPRYVTTRRGALLSEVDQTRVADSTGITVEVTKAVMKVMQSPRH
ncbi:competence protein ComFB [Sporobacter termitidis DSM 10068]|uniref:Competence protein ComFB n=1 Tax=Sporobacter termitidis DSM 10068 TaxID=1123282 RepID=A0A1M5UE39_9FIRM|nr:late competence development ComFB family protein [Sporobacter termitidis]SHH61325.1 competence protein ComFB [Sporobacter termitidis DSM 10068]